MHRTTREQLPVIAAGILAGDSYNAIARRLGLTRQAVASATKKWLPGLALIVSDATDGGNKPSAKRVPLVLAA